MYRLHRTGSGRPVRGLTCDETGLHFGGDWPLVMRGADGRYRSAPVDDIDRVLSAAYGVAVDFRPRYATLGRIAGHLTKGELGLAQVVALRLQLPELVDDVALDRLHQAARLLKFNPNHDERGRFSTAEDAAEGSDSAADASTWPAGARPVKSLWASAKAKAFIRGFEKLQLSAYDTDGAYVNTIGWGHKLQPGDPVHVTEREADALFGKDIAAAEDAVRRNVKVPLTQPQFDALVSVAFNKGEPGFRKSALLRDVNRSDFAAAANDFMTMTSVIVRDPQTHEPMRDPQTGKVRNRSLLGLLRRRSGERKIFEQGVY